MERKVEVCLGAMECGFLMPCYRFRGMDLGAQYEKVESEVREVFEALAGWQVDPSKKSREALMMECVDVQVAVETLMMLCGAGDDERAEARRKVWLKNDRRGYYDEKW